ncbi:MAG: 6-phospho-3-hexuloisomerase [Candidatus Odinarchaeota archaeon]
MDLFLQTMNEIIHHLKDYYDSFADEEGLFNAVDMILSARKVFIYGAGRSGMVGRMFAQRLMHLEKSSYYLSETITPAFTAEDCLVIISGSGETLTPAAIARGAKKIGGKIILLTANPSSTLGQLADQLIPVKGQTKDVKQESLAPFTSLFDITALTVLDSLARLIMNRTGRTEVDIQRTHATLE